MNGQKPITVLMNHGKNSFDIQVGHPGALQTVQINLTSSFDGLALPSSAVSP